ncbi:group II intron maturase-specific domain-containing protein [Nonomuraea sp. NPDC005701]|uniref:group II intron maturase-specific domain-containing protein n=1 Tax=Nonomuraea sp. NPDC005701 TaxID=3157049 RepID=UPI00340B4B10
MRRQRKRGTNKYFVDTKPSRKAVQAIRDKVSAKTHRSTRNRDLARLNLSLNRTLRGWANYFRHGVSKATFAAIDAHTWARLMRWIRRKYAGKARMGMPEFRRRFCDVGWRVAHQGIAFTGTSTVSVKRYRYRGGNIATPWAPTPATAQAADQQARHVERPVRGDTHAGCGGRAGETHRE